MRAVLLLAMCACGSRATAPPASSREPPRDAGSAAIRYTISAGVDHACARTPDGHVACWGELANLATVMRGSRFFPDLNPTRPVLVAGLDHVAGVEAGEDVHCAWTDRGEVSCWGAIGSQTTVAPTRIAKLDNVVQVSGGNLARMLCALQRDGHVACWGDPSWDHDAPDVRGQALIAPALIHSVPGVRDAIEIAVGFDHACARLASGAVVCWASPAPDHVDPIAPASGAIGIAGATNGGNTFVALLRGGHVYGWQLPDPSGAPIAVPDHLPADASSISLGAEACVLATPVTCWGIGDRATHTVAVEHAVDLSAGADVACARLADGGARCWGQDGMRGDGVASQALDAMPVPELANVISLSIADRTTCVVANGGKVYCWGAQISHVPQNDFDYPEDAAPIELPGITDALEVRVDQGAACARLATKRVVCWGSNDGRTKSGIWETPQRVRSLENGQPLAAGPCAGKACLARDHHRADAHIAKLLALPGVTSAASGGFAREGWTCVTTATDVQCVHEHYGREGTDYWPEHGFDRVEHGREVVSLPPGAGMCVRTADGHVACSDASDQLAPVPGVTDAIALGHGPNDSICALEASGTVACWPAELRAAHLGPGPAPVAGATDAKQLATGPDHACILRSDATVRCWGAWSLIGTGVVPARDVPHAVQLPAHRHA